MKVGDRVQFKSFGKIATGTIIEIVKDGYSRGNPIKVKPDNPKQYRQKIALKEKSVKVI